VAVKDFKWYVVHTYSGYEERVHKNLELRRQSMDAEGDITEVVIPTEEEMEVHGGQRKAVTTKILPGYILVNMYMNDQSWAIVRNTPGVTGFVSNENKPVPLRDDEYIRIMKQGWSECQSG
jgi:transcriptional antiterminator NusG